VIGLKRKELFVFSRREKKARPALNDFFVIGAAKLYTIRTKMILHQTNHRPSQRRIFPTNEVRRMDAPVAVIHHGGLPEHTISSLIV